MCVCVCVCDCTTDMLEYNMKANRGEINALTGEDNSSGGMI